MSLEPEEGPVMDQLDYLTIFAVENLEICINCQIDSVDMQEKRDNIRENHTIHRARCWKLSSLAMQC